jgi:hypothetical protein
MGTQRLTQRPATRWVYTLSRPEIAHVEALARARQGIKESHGVPSRRFDPHHDDLALHRGAVAAEYAVSRLLGLVMDERVSPAGNQRGWDLVTPGGTTIDVRYRQRRGWDLALTSADRGAFRAWIAILVWPGHAGDPPHTYELVGWLTRLQFVAWAKPADYGYGPRLVVPAARLAPLDTLAAVLAELENRPVWSQAGLPLEDADAP